MILHNLSSADCFLKSTFSKNSFKNTIRVSNSLDPDQARHYVRPDLGPNCLQRLQQTTLVVKELTLKAMLSMFILHTLTSPICLPVVSTFHPERKTGSFVRSQLIWIYSVFKKA